MKDTLSGEGTAVPPVDGDDEAAMTRAVRAADEMFQTSGGSSRHWIRDCFVPELVKEGLMLMRIDRVNALQKAATLTKGETLTIDARASIVASGHYKDNDKASMEVFDRAREQIEWAYIDGRQLSDAERTRLAERVAVLTHQLGRAFSGHPDGYWCYCKHLKLRADTGHVCRDGTGKTHGPWWCGVTSETATAPHPAQPLSPPARPAATSVSSASSEKERKRKNGFSRRGTR